MGLIKKYLLSSLLVIASLPGLAQELARYNWYFGNSTSGIRFNRSTGQATNVTNQATPFSPGLGGSGVASDNATANLLFYTDGAVVYDATHRVMPLTAGLTGNTFGNQPSAICAIPGQPNKYYIFTNMANFTAGGTISRLVIDMNQFGNAAFPSPATGSGEGTVTIVPGLANRSEGMMIVPHSNGTDFWLLTQQVNSQIYSATLINAATYTTGTFTTTNTLGIGLSITAANLSYKANLKKVAVSPQDASVDAHILNFDDATGTFSFDRYILNSGLPTTTNQAIYDIEWSLTGQFLYLSRHGEPGINANVFQFDYSNTTTTLAPVISTPIFRSYGLQMAPDSAIYHLYQATSTGPFLVGRLTQTDSVASEVIYTPSPFVVATDFNGKQFPSFLPKANVNLVVDFTTIGSCQNTPVTFFPDVTPGADSLNWTFGDGSDTTAWSPIHTYEQAQTFSVTLTAFYKGQSQAVTKPLAITAFPLQLQLVQDTTACRSEFPPPRGTSSPEPFTVTVQTTGGTPTSFIWSNGDTGPTLSPDSAGYYYVVVSDASGCSAYAGVNVKEYGLQDQRSNVWYFGNHAGIDFNTGAPVALNNSAMTAPAGCSIICDRNGQAIFYTDGDKVYNKNDIEIATGIGGNNPSSQSALIVPVPGDETLYYIFTTQEISNGRYELRYSLFDIKPNGGTGSVVKQNILLYSKSTERITASANWLISHEFGNNTFRAYPVTVQGIGMPVFSSIGSDHSFTPVENGEGYIKLGPRNNLAVALSTPGTSNIVELFHFNDSTGTLNNYRKIDLNQATGQVYGVEFSPGGNKLFATVKGSPSPSFVYEYFLDSLEHPYKRRPAPLSIPAEVGAIQIAPDGQIYMAINGSNVLGTISADDDTTRVSSINVSGFTLAGGTTSTLGLPNFIQQISNATGGPSMTFTGVCVGSPTEFVGTPTDAIDQFQWFFGDGGSDTQAAPSHTYAAANTYTVSMNLINRCGLDTTLVRPITIFAPPPRPTVTPATALCNGPITLDANSANLPGLTYDWNTGDTTKTVTLNVPSFITVTNTDTNGCSSTAQSIVGDNRPQLDLGPDLTICEDNSVTALDALNPGNTYTWTVNGGSPSATQQRVVDVTTPGVFTYQVVVTDPVTTCTLTEDKVFTINVSPSFTLSGSPPSACNTPDGSITLQLNASSPAGGPYSYFLTGPSGFNQQGIDQVAPSAPITFGGQLAGTFSGIVTDQISGCTISQAFGLSDPVAYSISTSIVGTNCAPVTLNVSSSPAASLNQFMITNSGTRAVIGPTTLSPTVSNFNTTPLDSGAYVIQTRDVGNCIVTTPVIVDPDPKVPTTITQDLCGTPASITASAPGAFYSWTGPGISTPVLTGQLNIPPSQSGSLTYQVVATAAGQCPNTRSITVNVEAPFTPTFSQTDPCATSIIVTAAPSGNYTYRWFREGVFQSTLGGQQITLPQSEDQVLYSVTLVSTINGCARPSAPRDVSIVGTVTAAVTATPACENDQPFTLTATTNNPAGSAYAWFYNNSATALAGATASTLSRTEAGRYKVEISRTICKATAELQIIKAPIPVGVLPDRALICNDPDNLDPATSKIDLDPGSFSQYNWLRNDVPLGYTQQVYTADRDGIFKVEITNSFGCVAPDQTEVVVDCVPRIDAPTAFRPSSSSLSNKDFSIFTFFITDQFQVFIYNRWGELVYQSNDRSFKWNGTTTTGQPAQSGTYAYVVKYISSFRPEKGVQEKRGGVVLLR